MKLYKFRPLADCKDYKRIKEIIEEGFYCCDFLNFNDMNEGVFSINIENIDIGLLDKQKYKICSFSGKNALNSQLMWGHYANAGMGVAIEIEVNDCKDIKEVTYNNSYEKLNSIEQILTHKSKEWEYENEFRYLTKNDCERKKIGNITKIYFGTPYKKLLNYHKIEKSHTKLKEYLKCKQELKKYLKCKQESKKICKNQKPEKCTCDYEFT
jgi:hypothetical protein